MSAEANEDGKPDYVPREEFADQIDRLWAYLEYLEERIASNERKVRRAEAGQGE